MIDVADPPVVGFVGLGNMGGALAANLVGLGSRRAHPRRGRARAQPRGRDVRGGRRRQSPERADVVVLSLPDGAVSEAVAREIVAAAERRVTHVVDTSTVGVRVGPVDRRPAGGRGRGLRRRPGVGRRRRGPRPHAVGDVRRARGGVRGRRAGAGRPERRPAPRRRPGRDGAGAEARQQLPVGHRARRHQRGDRLRPLGRARHGHDARRPQRVERPAARRRATSSRTTSSPAATPPGSPTP